MRGRADALDFGSTGGGNGGVASAGRAGVSVGVAFGNVSTAIDDTVGAAAALGVVSGTAVTADDEAIGGIADTAVLALDAGGVVLDAMSTITTPTKSMDMNAAAATPTTITG